MDTIQAKDAHSIAQVAFTDHVPPAPAVDERIGVQIPLVDFQLAAALVAYVHLALLTGCPAKFLQDWSQVIQIGPVHAGSKQGPASPSDLMALLIGENIVQFSQCTMSGIPVKPAPHLFHQAGAQVNCYSFLGGKD